MVKTKWLIAWTSIIIRTHSTGELYRTPLGIKTMRYSIGGYTEPLSYATVAQDWNISLMRVLRMVQGRV
jgi:hypothetical protein